MLTAKLPNGATQIVSSSEGLVTLNILDFFPDLKSSILEMNKALPQFIQHGKSPKASQTFGKFNNGLYRNVGEEDPVLIMNELSSQIETLPGYMAINAALQKVLKDLFPFKIEEAIFETHDHGQEIVAPAYVWRDLTGGTDGIAAGFHLDDILRDISLFGPDHYNRLRFLKDLRAGEQDPYASIETSEKNVFAISQILERQRFVSNTFTQLAFNLFVSIPKSGGETDIAFPTGMQQYVGRKIGDLAIFNSQVPHQIRASSDLGDRRYTMAGFIGVNKSNQVGYQFG